MRSVPNKITELQLISNGETPLSNSKAIDQNSNYFFSNFSLSFSLTI